MINSQILSSKKNVLLISGGGGSEHQVSLKSALYFKEKINPQFFEVYDCQMNDQFTFKYGDKTVYLNPMKQLIDLATLKPLCQIDVAIPCLHGYPGETGHIQAYFEMIKLPFLGANSESSIYCFNKITTKLWLEQIQIPQVPFLAVYDLELQKKEINEFASKCQNEIFIKASSQGSSVGCYPLEKNQNIFEVLKQAFQFSPYAILEKKVKARELEVSVFQYNGQIHTTFPGEINCPSGFYSFEEKYNQKSKTNTSIRADVSNQIADEIQKYALKSFELFKLSHLARIDFFLVDQNVYLNEINTFPGHTSISMFPQMLEATGIKYQDFLTETLKNLVK